MADKSKPTGKKIQFHYAFLVVAGGFIIMGLLHSMIQTCFSFFLVPVTEALGASRTEFALCSSIIAIMTMILSPKMGAWLAGKHTRIIFSACIFGMGLSYASYSLASNIRHMYISAFFVGIFSCGSVILPVSIVISRWFAKGRGTAMSAALAGSGLGGTVITPIVNHLIYTYGSGRAFFIFGMAMIAIGVPIAFFIMGPSPEDRGMKPFGAEEETPDLRQNGLNTVSDSGKQNALREDVDSKTQNALRKETDSADLSERSGQKGENIASVGIEKKVITLDMLKKESFFYVFLAGIFMICFVGYGGLAHMTAALTDSYGVDFSTVILALMMLILTPSKILLGFVYDRFGARIGTLYAMTMYAIAMVMLAVSPANRNIMYAMALIYALGTASGTVTPSVATASLFGPEDYGRIYGMVNCVGMMSMVVGGPILGMIYDLFGSYRWAWVLCCAFCILGALAVVYAYKKCKKLMQA